MSYKTIGNWISLIKDPRVRRSAAVLSRAHNTYKTKVAGSSLEDAINKAFSWYSSLESILVGSFWATVEKDTKRPSTRSILSYLSEVPEGRKQAFNDRLNAFSQRYCIDYYEIEEERL